MDYAKGVQKKRNPDTQEEYPRYVEEYEKSRPEPRLVLYREDSNNRGEEKQCRIFHQAKICTHYRNGVGQPQKISYDERRHKDRLSNPQIRAFVKGVSEKKGLLVGSSKPREG